MGIPLLRYSRGSLSLCLLIVCSGWFDNQQQQQVDVIIIIMIANILLVKRTILFNEFFHVGKFFKKEIPHSIKLPHYPFYSRSKFVVSFKVDCKLSPVFFIFIFIFNSFLPAAFRCGRSLNTATSLSKLFFWSSPFCLYLFFYFYKRGVEIILICILF